jgi:tetratricopeptide (TPR) repeat protein
MKRLKLILARGLLFAMATLAIRSRRAGYARIRNRVVVLPSLSAVVHRLLRRRDLRRAKAAYKIGELLMCVRVLEDVGEHYVKSAGLTPGEYPVLGALRSAAGGSVKPNEPIAWFRAAIKHDPHFSEAHYFLGWRLFEAGDMKTAAEAFARAANSAPRLTLDPTDAPLCVKALHAQGQALAEFGDASAARKSLLRATRSFPNYIPPFVLLGRLAVKEGNTEMAAQYFLESFRPAHNVQTLPKLPRLDNLQNELAMARLEVATAGVTADL